MFCIYYSTHSPLTVAAVGGFLCFIAKPSDNRRLVPLALC